MKWKDTEIAEWIVILFVFLFVTYPMEMIYLSETSLGKLAFVMVIAYFTMIDSTYGLIVCCIVIAYYQLGLYDSLIAIHRDTLMAENMDTMKQSLLSTPKSTVVESNVAKNAVEGFRPGDSSIYSYEPYDTASNFQESDIMGQERKKELMSYFRRENCNAKGELIHKGSTVRPDYAEHVFRELKFDSAKCNPCQPGCQFSIIEEKLATEEKIARRPKNAKEEPVDWEKLFGHYIVTPVSEIAHDITAVGNKFSEWIM